MNQSSPDIRILGTTLFLRHNRDDGMTHVHIIQRLYDISCMVTIAIAINV